MPSRCKNYHVLKIIVIISNLTAARITGDGAHCHDVTKLADPSQLDTLTRINRRELTSHCSNRNGLRVLAVWIPWNSSHGEWEESEHRGRLVVEV